MKKIIYFLLLSGISVLSSLKAEPVRIACIGASITEGYGVGSQNSFPGQLQSLLGGDYRVSNFGVSGTTMLKRGNYPYWSTTKYQDALQSNPDIVFIDLGGNDAKAENRPYYNDLENDSREMIRSFTSLPSRPRVIVLLPTAFFVTDVNYIYDPVCVEEIVPRLQKAAYEEGVEVLDMHPILLDHPDWVPDQVHPNTQGAALLAKRLYEQIKLKWDENDFFPTYLTVNQITLTEGYFYGYKYSEFSYQGNNCRIIFPERSESTHPWLWRSRFWDKEPLSDILLLERGFHIVYYDQIEKMGNSEAVAAWDDLYAFLVAGGLNSKAVIAGMDIGAVYGLNWAAVNPGRVVAVYLDNPLLDMKSLFIDPEGNPKEDSDYSIAVENAYGITREEIAQFTGSPIDQTEQIVSGNYPILLLYAENDELMPNVRNAFPFERKIKEQGGNITLYEKKESGHDDFGLPNPAPVTAFIMESCGLGMPKNLALGCPAVASSVSDNCPPENLTDGNTGTRWSSAYTSQEWIYIDLGNVKAINEIKLYWEAAYGKSYKIQASNDAQTWIDIYTQTNGQGGSETVSFSDIQARYIKMQGVARATSYGFSLWEMEVYGNDAATGLQLPATAEENPVRLFPNPAGDRLFVQGITGFDAGIYNLQGNRLLLTHSNPDFIDISRLQPGMYVIILNKNHQVYNKRFIKK